MTWPKREGARPWPVRPFDQMPRQHSTRLLYLIAMSSAIAAAEAEAPGRILRTHWIREEAACG